MATPNPFLFLLSDYPSLDTGADGGYANSLYAFFPDLDFGSPDRVKVLETVEVVYVSLHEVPITIGTFRGAAQTDAGTTLETSVFTPPSSPAQEPGWFWGGNQAAAGSFATLREFRSILAFDTTQGKSISVGLKVQADLTPFTLVRLVLRYTLESQPQYGGKVV
jgi:hypothetical protein